MKNTIFLAVAALFFSASLNAQSTVDSIAAKYQLLPMPGQMTLEQRFPVIGTYQLQGAATSDANVSIALDSLNKGVIWVSGLPQGKFKAYLKKSPSTYRILSQKTADGKQIPEGTLFYDATANTLNIAIGSSYNEADPTSIFALHTSADMSTDAMADNTVKVKTKTSTSKTKAKVSFYTASKLDQGTSAAPVNQQQ
ncbi:MAG: hypothetical protein ABIN57_04875 [Chitinophagaceae bacterium]